MQRVAPERAAQTAVVWAAAEGWDPGLDDGERFLAADRDAFIGVEGADGEVAGTVSCALYGDGYAFIGFYIVREDLRGRGIGTQVFALALERAAGRAIGLDGVLEQEALYASLGFEPAHRSARWAGTGIAGPAPDGLVALDAVALAELAAYDRPVFGAPREAFLGAWTSGRPAGHALAARTDDGTLRGYAVLRPTAGGAKVGPLFADDPDTAERLLAGLRAAAGPETTVFLDVPGANPSAAALAARTLDAPVFEAVRMYRGGRPPEDVSRVYGVTTFELG